MARAEELPLEGRYVRLIPPPLSFLDELYHLAAMNRVPWQWSGPETIDAFRESLWARALVVFAIQDRRHGRCVGLLKADGANMFHGYAYLTMVLHPDFRMRVWPLEAALLFGNYLFMKFNLQNLYAETSESTLEQFRSGIGKTFEVEGQLRGRLLVNGRREDLYILAFKRERALAEAAPLLERLSRHGPDA